MNRKKWIKASMALSALLFVIWWALGTGATLAWFNDADTVRNEFQIGLLDMNVNYKNDIVTAYTPVLSTTPVFHDEALYEPGYTQVVYLEIENKGNVDFQYKIAVTVEKVVEGGGVYLPNYLRCGMVFAESEAVLEEEVSQRLKARTHATQELGTWSEISPYTFEVGEAPHYAALIIYMPEEVGNAANYRGPQAPSVELGVKIFAQQANAPME